MDVGNVNFECVKLFTQLVGSRKSTILLDAQIDGVIPLTDLIWRALNFARYVHTIAMPPFWDIGELPPIISNLPLSLITNLGARSIWQGASFDFPIGIKQLCGKHDPLETQPSKVNINDILLGLS